MCGFWCFEGLAGVMGRCQNETTLEMLQLIITRKTVTKTMGPFIFKNFPMYSSAHSLILVAANELKRNFIDLVFYTSAFDCRPEFGLRCLQILSKRCFRWIMTVTVCWCFWTCMIWTFILIWEEEFHSNLCLEVDSCHLTFALIYKRFVKIDNKFNCKPIKF